VGTRPLDADRGARVSMRLCVKCRRARTAPISSCGNLSRLVVSTVGARVLKAQPFAIPRRICVRALGIPPARKSRRGERSAEKRRSLRSSVGGRRCHPAGHRCGRPAAPRCDPGRAPLGAPPRLFAVPGHAFGIARFAMPSASSWQGDRSIPRVELRAARVRLVGPVAGAASIPFSGHLMKMPLGGWSNWNIII
jgi:hypothetical protein